VKKTLFVVMALIYGYATGFAQSKTPDAVTKAFKAKFPTATAVNWDKEGANEYEASFMLKEEKYSASFDKTGDWLETESPFKWEQLPDKVQNAFDASHKGATIKMVAKIESAKGGIKYEIEVKQGAKTLELFYYENGTKASE
jgi:hypothetical protein